MSRHSEQLIAQLVDELRPIVPLHPRRGHVWAVEAAVLAVALVVFGPGVRSDLMAGQPAPLFLVSSGIFLLLAAATSWTAIEMGRPSVGMYREGWAWATLMAALLPAAALLTLLLDLTHGHPIGVDTGGLHCLTMGTELGLVMAATLTLWLRRGAPSSPARAGLIVGLAAGATGIFAVSLFCPHDDIAHIGLWHGGAIALCAALGRFIVPRFIRW